MIQGPADPWGSVYRAVSPLCDIPDTVAAAALAALITIGYSHWQQCKRANASRLALLKEVELCGAFAAEYLNKLRPPHRITSPLYRLPKSAFDTAFPILLEAGAISKDSSDVIIRFFSEVDTFNRGLDDASQFHRHYDWDSLKWTTNRNTLKASRIANPAATESVASDNHFERARSALRGK